MEKHDTARALLSCYVTNSSLLMLLYVTSAPGQPLVSAIVMVRAHIQIYENILEIRYSQ